MRVKTFVLFLVLVGVVYPARAENLAQLLSDTRTLIFDGASGARQRYTDSQLTELLNVGQRQANSTTQCLEKSFSFQLQLGVTYYSLPSDYLGIERVILGSLYIQEMSPAALDGRSRGWEQSSGYPTYYFINWSSPTLIGFAPYPQVATDTNTVKVEYTQGAADLAASTDVPFNGVPKLAEYHHALAYYAAAVVMASYGKADRSKAYMDVFAGTVAMMGSRCRARRNYLPSGSGSP